MKIRIETAVVVKPGIVRFRVSELLPVSNADSYAALAAVFDVDFLPTEWSVADYEIALSIGDLDDQKIAHELVKSVLTLRDTEARIKSLRGKVFKVDEAGV